ncbi:MAG: TA system VapC family ribonuclease toxin [Tepidiformaceae bacterium]
MSQTVDANVLLYAADAENPRQSRARDLLQTLTEGPEILYVFWPVVLAYVRISTLPSLFRNPLTLEAAVADIDYLLSGPNVLTVSEGRGFWKTLSEVLTESRSRGNLVSDAHLVALMRQYGVSTIYTHDLDFRKFDGIRVVDPFV